MENSSPNVQALPELVIHHAGPLRMDDFGGFSMTSCIVYWHLNQLPCSSLDASII